jgi:gamma-glutamylcyclotransferase (GGCT)/AIG2-like uncharacterized protein YtfP
MKNTFYRPAEVDTRKFDRIVREMRENLVELVAGEVKNKEIIDYVQKLIADGKPLPKDPSMLFWGFAEPETMPGDARVEYFYMPTYIAVSILTYVKMHGPYEAIQLEGFEETLEKGLYGATGRGFSGSGHDGLKGLIEAMDLFTRAQVHEFVRRYPEICPKFTAIFLDAKKILEKRLDAGKVLGDWGEDYTKEAAAVIHRMKDTENNTLVFVYGTLMYGNANHKHYLANSRYLGDGVLHGYALYDLGSYPGVKPSESDQVLGEVYSIDAETLERVNYLEGEGSLYSLQKVRIEMEKGTFLEAGVYVYLHDVKENDKVRWEDQPWGKGIDRREDLVWYAAYGSNMLLERFMCYINGTSFKNQGRAHAKCIDTTPPRAIMPYELPHDMYYGNSSRSWDGKGVAFLDATKPGKAYGVAYLITEEQFNHVCREENGGGEPRPDSPWYNHKAELGTYHGILVKTVTNHGVREKNEASRKYLDVLREGLRENYPEISDEEISRYLLSRNS